MAMRGGGWGRAARAARGGGRAGRARAARGAGLDAAAVCGACGLAAAAGGGRGAPGRGALDGWQQAFFCRECEGVLPPAAAAAGATHFSRLGLDPGFLLSARELEARLRAAQWLLHPDKFSQASQEEQQRSEAQATLVNESVSVLGDPVRRALYMLELEGLEIGEGAGLDGGSGGLQLDSEVLLKVMEVREAVEEAEGEELARLGRENVVEVEGCCNEFAKALESGDTAAAQKAAIRLIYLQRIAEAVKDKE